MAFACPIFKTLLLCVAAYIITVIRMLTAQITLELKQIENYFQPVKSVGRVVEGAAPPTMQFKMHFKMFRIKNAMYCI